jgi:hypothetical protein
MSASLRTRRVAVYSYSAPVDSASGIARSTYTRVLSSDADGLWWAVRGSREGRETSPTGATQHVTHPVYGFDAEVTLTVDGLIVDGGKCAKITALLPRDIGRNEQQVLCEQVDDADSAYELEEPELEEPE